MNLPKIAMGGDEAETEITGWLGELGLAEEPGDVIVTFSLA